MIRTPRLNLVPCDVPTLLAVVAGSEALSAHLEVSVPAGWPAFPDAYVHALEVVRADPGIARWWTHLFIDPKQAVLVGAGGYTGRPGDDGTVEIGYEIAPEYRGRDLAFEAARGLVDHAFLDPGVSAVIAHTLAEMNASTRVLEKIGMRHVETLEDPNDGTLWRWRLDR